MAREKVLTLASFPPLTNSGSVGRRLYFDEAPEYLDDLVTRGYQVVMLASLPRDDQAQEQQYLKAKLQGVEEGTVQVTDAQLAALRASLELYFGTKLKSNLTLVARRGSEGILEALDWQNSRFTMKGNTTLVEARENPLGVAPPAPPPSGKATQDKN